jgi:ABC-type transporter MlaC component
MMDICLIIQNSIMKNIILFATLAITAIGCAQSKDKKVVPKVVKEVFKRISKYEGSLGY